MNVLSELESSGFRTWVSDLWGIRIDRTCRSADIQGSPERSLSRAVFQDNREQRFLVEKFATAKFGVRDRVARTLEYLNQQGLARALAPERAMTGEFLARYGTGYFQITRFLDGTDLERPGWLMSPEIGREMAAFLGDMNRAARGISGKISYPGFSIKAYVYGLFRDMERHAPEIHTQYLPVLRFLEQGFMGAHDSLSLRFCHGDFHPLNVIWNGRRIASVIDWEFTGVKPDCYDAANLVGCAGIEHPEGLAMPMATSFLKVLRRQGQISETGWNWFPEYVLALRFAWLSEWLRKKDQEMLETELAFMTLLIRHMEDLRDIWAFREDRP